LIRAGPFKEIAEDRFGEGRSKRTDLERSPCTLWWGPIQGGAFLRRSEEVREGDAKKRSA